MGCITTRNPLKSRPLFLACLTWVTCASTSALQAQTYTTDFPLTENPISENGKWINGKTVGVDWNNVKTANGRATGRNHDDLWWTDATAILTGTWGPDQVATATVYCPSAVPQNTEIELRLRSSLSAHHSSGYECLFNCSWTSEAYMMIVRWNGPEQDYTILKQVTGSTYGVKHGDEIKGTIMGNVITMYINGTQKLQVTDNTIKSGSPGIGLCNAYNPPVDSWGFTSYSVTATGGSTDAAPRTPGLSRGRDFVGKGHRSVSPVGVDGRGLRASTTRSGFVVTSGEGSARGLIRIARP